MTTPSQDEYDRLLSAFDEACTNSDGRTVTWKGYSHADRIRVMRRFAAAMLRDMFNELSAATPAPAAAGDAVRALDVYTYEPIRAELAKAITKFPTWPTDPLHAVAVVGEEFGELTKAVLQHTYEPHKSTLADVREEAIQCAAMTVRFIASLDLYIYERGKQHEQQCATELEAALANPPQPWCREWSSPQQEDTRKVTDADVERIRETNARITCRCGNPESRGGMSPICKNCGDVLP